MVYAMLWYGIVLYGEHKVNAYIRDHINYYAGHKETVLSGETLTA